MGKNDRKRGPGATDVKPDKVKKPRLAKPPAATKPNKRLKAHDSKASSEQDADSRTGIVAKSANGDQKTSTATSDLAQDSLQQTTDDAHEESEIDSIQEQKKQWLDYTTKVFDFDQGLLFPEALRKDIWAAINATVTENTISKSNNALYKTLGSGFMKGANANEALLWGFVLRCKGDLTKLWTGQNTSERRPAMQSFANVVQALSDHKSPNAADIHLLDSQAGILWHICRNGLPLRRADAIIVKQEPEDQQDIVNHQLQQPGNPGQVVQDVVRRERAINSPLSGAQRHQFLGELRQRYGSNKLNKKGEEMGNFAGRHDTLSPAATSLAATRMAVYTKRESQTSDDDDSESSSDSEDSDTESQVARVFTQEEMDEKMSEYVRIMEAVPAKLRGYIRDMWTLKLFMKMGEDPIAGLAAFSQDNVEVNAANEASHASTPKEKTKSKKKKSRN
ncbi:hypothetical protein CGCVW01_v003316 [Colletotrichum viniferum]|nr:hypothetical protein CGCVW01_v003316 [Colletotrichum viniferum]